MNYDAKLVRKIKQEHKRKFERADIMINNISQWRGNRQ
jgi:hypothetical protein